MHPPAETIQKAKAKRLDINRVKAELCRRKLSYFVREFWECVVQDELVWSAHIDIFCNEVEMILRRVFNREEKQYDLIINVPPGTSKSTIITIMAPAWAWCCDPSIRTISSSYSESLSTEHAVKSRDIIKSDKFKLYFPEVELKRDEDNKTNYKTTKGGQRFATSTGGTVTGTHAHVIIIDDPLNPKQAASEAQLHEANFWFDKTIPTRKVDKKVSVMIVVMQRLATNDPTGHLLEKKKEGIRHVCLPGELSPDVSPPEYRKMYTNGLLDPIRLDRNILKELQTDLGSDGFAGQIMQTPVPAGGLIWQKWFIEVDDLLFPDSSKLTQYGTDWDLAYTKDDMNAASAYVTAGKIGNDNFIDDIGWEWLEYPDLIAYMKTKVAPHYIEAKASGKSAKQSLTRDGVNAIEVNVKGGNDKIARAKMATVPVEAGRWYIRKSLADKLYSDSKQGILFFPKGPFKDLADALAQSISRLDKNATIISGPGSGSILDFL
jgi:phage terminase large subunit-like protein